MNREAHRRLIPIGDIGCHGAVVLGPTIGLVRYRGDRDLRDAGAEPLLSVGDVQITDV